MQKLETERLVRKLAVLDNRTVNDGVVDAWHELVGHLTYRVAELAVRKARQDASINWVEPKHVLAKAHDAAKELNEQATKLARQAEDNGTGAPQPKCAEHGLRITTCKDCCLTIYFKSLELPADRLHSWAIGNGYEDLVL